MRVSASEAQAWTRRRWILTVLGIGCLQVLAVMVLGQKTLIETRPASFGTQVHFALDAPASKRWLADPLVSDPTVFALPHEDGFSGSGWLKYTPFEHQMGDWTEPPRWLEMDPGQLGKSFAAFVAGNASPILRIADKPMPTLIASEVIVPSEPVPSRTEFRIEGGLRRRPIRWVPDLPSWHHSDILSNTVLQLMIDGMGYPVSATLLAGSGRRDADQFALEVAGEARFQPLNKSELNLHPARVDWGRMIIRWHTLPESATNGTRLLQ